MTRSMTAFVRVADQGDWGAAVCECRSVNHRYLEPAIRLPEDLRALENPLRAKIKQALHRGKLECTIKYTPSDTTTPHLTIQQTAVAQLFAQRDRISAMADDIAPLRMVDVLNWPGVISQQAVDLTQAQQAILVLFDKAMAEMIAMRQREGQAVQALLNARLDAIITQVDAARQIAPAIVTERRAKLMTLLADMSQDVVADRLEQELVMYAQKIDVTEELDRLSMHVKEVQRVLQHDSPQGRRLDFLMQELNREANTLASKSATPALTKIAVELKVLIEQMREQVQNIE